MRLYNTLTKNLEEFQPRGDEVTIYVCGITPYDTTHLGHAFTYISTDLLIRYLELWHLKIRYVQNVTDIDDDILRKAKEVGEDWLTVGNRWTRHFIEDMKRLNVRPPNHFPRATEVIPYIIQNVEALLKAGVAYEIEGNVYYSVDSWSEFGKLSHLRRDQMLPIANQRGNDPHDPHKRDPLDFILWQAQKEGEPGWNSPWGIGRPGWHIECSTMARHYLGDGVDIHGGGEDLCFPHHECEIAQVEPATGFEPFVRFWVHTAMVRYRGEKMSKSLGNLVMVRDLMKTYTEDGLRIYLGSHHYRDSWEYVEQDLNYAQHKADIIREALEEPHGSGAMIRSEDAWANFTAALDEDLNTPKALEVMVNLAEEILAAEKADRDVSACQATLRKFAAVFGMRLDQDQLEPRVVDGWNAFLKKF